MEKRKVRRYEESLHIHPSFSLLFFELQGFHWVYIVCCGGRNRIYLGIGGCGLGSGLGGIDTMVALPFLSRGKVRIGS